MIARGFKSIGWVAAVGSAALGCYMVSLRVAAERADLAAIEQKIVATRHQIRALHTELGTRGRLSQLERWNSEVLALSAPSSGQFVNDAFSLARLDLTTPDIGEAIPTPALRMASAETQAPSEKAALETGDKADAADGAVALTVAAKPVPAIVASPSPGREPAVALVRRASIASLPAPGVAPRSQGRRLDARLSAQIGAAARAEGADAPTRPKAIADRGNPRMAPSVKGKAAAR